ncbi:hypothetical protein C9374_005972 [Naegleria lovaniensis]|uniref:UDENN FLCN/SMCR8-type domain-containing protein n=1 Tax=Naegleria lovaniensis TaxID=51637 RepID=A0AA88KJA1_NAELO|nr:uncharacterized protein C9374_005972 [Naegleria lovaniensis]KAG2381588.1 hypothetical protein C9374_005972 [Naegleria lovaniensis]
MTHPSSGASSTHSSSSSSSTYHQHHPTHSHHHHAHHRPHQHAHCRFQPPNPKHQPLFRKDFIVMAEFCEQKGPTPLLILPSERSVERFNVQKFVTRVLAGDHTRKHDKLGDNLTWICPEDTQVYLTDPVQGAFAYVHHLTLHDINARGYVRPLVICYVTNDKDKIMHHFEYLVNAFTQVSHTLKYGNNCKFLSDIQQQLYGIQKIEKRFSSSENLQNNTNNSDSPLLSNPTSQNLLSSPSSGEDAVAANSDNHIGDHKLEKRWKEIYEGLFSPSKGNGLSRETFEQVLTELKDLRRRFMLHINKSSAILKCKKNKNSKKRMTTMRASALQHHSYLFSDVRSRSASNSSGYSAGIPRSGSLGSNEELSDPSINHHDGGITEGSPTVENINEYRIVPNNGSPPRLEESDSADDLDEEQTEIMLSKIVDEETLDSGLIDHIYLSCSAGGASVSSVHLHPSMNANPKINVSAVPLRSGDQQHFASKQQVYSGASVGGTTFEPFPNASVTSSDVSYATPFSQNKSLYHHSPLVNALNDIDNNYFNTNASSSLFSLSSLKHSNPDFIELYDSGLSVSSTHLKQYMPTVLRCIHRNTDFESVLRNISQIAGSKFYETAVDLMLNILEHFYRDCDVIDIENQDLDIVNSNDINSMLFIGRNFLLDFNIENGYHFPPTLNATSYSRSFGVTANYSINSNLSTHSSNDEATWMENENTFNDMDEALSTTSHDDHDTPNLVFPSLPPSPVAFQPEPVHTSINNNISPSANNRYHLYKNGFKGTGCYVNSIFPENEKYDDLFHELKKRKRNYSPTASSGGNNGNMLNSGQSGSLLSSLLFEYNYGDNNFGKGILRIFKEFSFTKDIAYTLMIGRPLIIYGEPSQEQTIRALVNAFALFVPGFISSLSCDTTKADYFQICHWKTTPINLLDFSYCKIIGLSKKVPIPSMFESWISVFDFENDYYSGPIYCGRYLDIIFDESKEWGSEDAFLSFTHAIFLEMGMKASLFNQLFSITKTRSHFYKKSLHKISTSDVNSNKEKDTGRASLFGPMFPSLTPQLIHKGSMSSPAKRSKSKKGGAINNNNLASQSTMVGNSNASLIGSGALESMKDCSKTIQRQLGLKACDAKIIDYLVDLIHVQQSKEMLVFNCNTIKVDTEMCTKHLNKRRLKK